jgi:hypothetical protein
MERSQGGLAVGFASGGVALLLVSDDGGLLVEVVGAGFGTHPLGKDHGIGGGAYLAHRQFAFFPAPSSCRTWARNRRLIALTIRCRLSER